MALNDVMMYVNTNKRCLITKYALRGQLMFITPKVVYNPKKWFITPKNGFITPKNMILCPKNVILCPKNGFMTPKTGL